MTPGGREGSRWMEAGPVRSLGSERVFKNGRLSRESRAPQSPRKSIQGESWQRALWSFDPKLYHRARSLVLRSLSGPPYQALLWSSGLSAALTVFIGTAWKQCVSLASGTPRYRMMGSRRWTLVFRPSPALDSWLGTSVVGKWVSGGDGGDGLLGGQDHSIHTRWCSQPRLAGLTLYPGEAETQIYL